MLRKFREYLTKFDYPGIQRLDEDEVANVFHPNNRIFLLTWIIKQIDESYAATIESRNAETLLAEFIYENGFCRSPQKDLFVKGDPKLDFVEQVWIINKMLSMLDDVREEQIQSKSESGVSSQPLSLHDLKSSLNEDINLFDSLGYTKTRTFEERHSEIEKYQQELQTLKAEIESLKQNGACESQIESITYDEKLEENLEELRRSTNDLCINASLLSQQKDKFDVPDFKLKISKEFAENCDCHFSKVVKVIKNTNTISTYSDVSKSIDLLPIEENNEDFCFPVVNELLSVL